MSKLQEIKYIHCSDYIDFLSMKVGVLKSFCLPLELNIGPIKDDATDIFQIMVISSDQIAKYVEPRLIVLPIFDPKLIVEIVEGIVSYCNTKNDPIGELRKYFHWEYENMRFSG